MITTGTVARITGKGAIEKDLCSFVLTDRLLLR